MPYNGWHFLFFASGRACVRKPCRHLPEPGPPFPLFPARWFAYENRIHWLSREVSANQAAARDSFPLSSGTRFALGNRVHWLSREVSANQAAARDSFPLSSGTRFALGNRVHWLSWDVSANQAADSPGFTKQQTCTGQQQLDYEPRRACN